MAEKEMYDYIEASSPDYNATLDISPQNVVIEDVTFRQTKYVLGDGEHKASSPSTTPFFIVTLEFNVKSKSDIGTIYDFFLDDEKAFGLARSFKWDHPSDGHTYIVKFWTDIGRTLKTTNIQGTSKIKLAVIGRVDDV